MQLVAYKPGQEILIPEIYRAQFARDGYSFRGASSELEQVRTPTPLVNAKKKVASAAPAIAAPVVVTELAREGDLVTALVEGVELEHTEEEEPPAPTRRRRRRKAGDA